MDLTITSEFDARIQTIAHEADVPMTLVKAIVWQESDGRPYAFNPEPRYRYLWDNRLRKPFRPLTSIEGSSEIPPPDFVAVDRDVDRDAEWWGQQMSWGLMQVMGAVAREYGFAGDFLSELCVPAVGLEYGCRHLAHLHRRFGPDWAPVIAAYNAGSPRQTASGAFENQEYVDSVLRKWETINTAFMGFDERR
jgi:hypothetical protein